MMAVKMVMKHRREEGVPVMEMAAGELHVVELLAAANAQLFRMENIIEKRLRSIPDGWRQYRIAMSASDRMLDGVYATVPDKQLMHMHMLVQNGECVIRPRPASRTTDDVQIVMTKDMTYLVNIAMMNECATCIRDPQEQRRCKMRKVLLNLTPPRQTNESRCPYMDVACKSELGKYI